MLKSRIIILVVSLILIVGLFLLPKIVVDNENEQITSEEGVGQDQPKTEGRADNTDPAHAGEMSEEVLSKINRLRNKYLSSENEEKSVIFADSLALLFKEESKLDSAAKYTELATDNAEAIGDAYYDAYTYAVDAEKANELGEKTRLFYEKVLAEDAGRLDVKTKIAMTYVSSDNPMAGIMMLREVLEKDPKNEDALFNLGILSIQSGQYKNAIERFNTLLENHPDNDQAMFYLALSYFNDGQKEKARSLFEKIKNKSTDEQVLAAVESYLNEL
ncbi:tetratricopeptide repeat protein [Marivirga sp. S37H4]|uniref:Tetratricopeptide repeat protein n=1 Tax=Marivirga aurantiaca TaxID=2802615 RepID=A0A935CCF0_9BACT|nr:tetratricopeptide repeat protein [Marivirga aurantiaca]MBK6265993.1 tetratricopeptide repeat protein [Marivirga aurantiaca]